MRGIETVNQTTSMTSLSAPVRGAAIMTAAGFAFAGLNVALQWATMKAGVSAPAVAFWQYLIALALDSRADALVSGDSDLHGLDVLGLRVFTPRELLDRYLLDQDV